MTVLNWCVCLLKRMSSKKRSLSSKKPKPTKRTKILESNSCVQTPFNQTYLKDCFLKQSLGEIPPLLNIILEYIIPFQSELLSDSVFMKHQWISEPAFGYLLTVFDSKIFYQSYQGVLGYLDLVSVNRKEISTTEFHRMLLQSQISFMDPRYWFIHCPHESQNYYVMKGRHLRYYSNSHKDFLLIDRDISYHSILDPLELRIFEKGNDRLLTHTFIFPPDDKEKGIEFVSYGEMYMSCWLGNFQWDPFSNYQRMFAMGKREPPSNLEHSQWIDLFRVDLTNRTIRRITQNTTPRKLMSFRCIPSSGYMVALFEIDRKFTYLWIDPETGFEEIIFTFHHFIDSWIVCSTTQTLLGLSGLGPIHITLPPYLFKPKDQCPCCAAVDTS